MGDRDYRVTYRSREQDLDGDRYDNPRRRIPTALDPYAYPEDREELKRAVAETKARNARLRDEYREYEPPTKRDTFRDDVTTVKDPSRAGTTKTTYSVTDTGLAKESQVTTKAPTSLPFRDPAPVSRVSTQRDVSDFDGSRALGRSVSRPYDDRDYQRMERIYDVERPRREPGGYIVDMGDAKIVGIRSGPGLVEPDRGFAGYRGDSRNYELEPPPRNSYTRDPPTRGPGGYRKSETAFLERDDDIRTSAPAPNGPPYMSGARQDRNLAVRTARSQTDFRGPPSRATTRAYEGDWESTTAAPYGPSRQSIRREEDDYAFVEKTTTTTPRDRAPTVRESFKDPFADGNGPSDAPRGRPCASTYTSRGPEVEGDYVMVTPPRETATVVSRRATEVVTPAPTEPRKLRSSLVRADSYTAEERMQQRRSRSINFRDDDCNGHHRGDKFCERPGAEAAMMGKYLNHYDADDQQRNIATYQYGGGRSSRAKPERRDYDDADYRRAGDAEAYGSRARSKSRRRDEDDDRDHYDTYRSKTTKTTYY